tara:strand:+ start:15837 stop:16508 length:672 start_codon:yes stop_codon:yes gene_type:complete
MKAATNIAKGGLLAGLLLSAASAQAQLYFHFEETAGGDVTMTASGSIDTNDLTPVAPESWGGIGIEENGETDIMGDTASGSTDAHFGFSAGTDYSAWDAPTGPFASSNFNWTSTATRSFHIYTREGGERVPGLGVVQADLVGGVWTPDATWTQTDTDLATVGLIPGTYTVVDASSGAFITIQVGGELPPPPVTEAVPVPTLPLWGLLALAGLFGFAGARRLRG